MLKRISVKDAIALQRKRDTWAGNRDINLATLVCIKHPVRCDARSAPQVQVTPAPVQTLGSRLP